MVYLQIWLMIFSLNIIIIFIMMQKDKQSYSRSAERSARGSSQQMKKRYKYCCRKCKHTQGNRKSCVCVVPLSQRRTQLGQQGCQTCRCTGCSIEDYISRGEDPQYRPSKFRQNNDRNDDRNDDRKDDHRHSDHGEHRDRHSDERFDPKNGCCRKCMKAFSKTGKSCLCQVPRSVRKTKLPGQGCKICGCTGCNPRDYKQSASNRSDSSSRRSISSVREQVDSKQLNLNNTDNSMLGKVIIVQYNLFPGMLGLGIPQRTPNYILGKPL